MSVRVTGAIWSAAGYEGGSLLVLLALADWANDDGVCWPKIAAIAQKARLTERQTKNILKRLEGDGVIGIERGNGRGVANRYCIRTACFAASKRVKPPLPKKGEICGIERVKSEAQKGEICDIAIRKNRHIEPSYEPSGGAAAHEPPCPALSLPLKDGTEFHVTQAELAKWQDAFRGIDVGSELQKARCWLEANPSRRKTREGIRRFVVSWLGRASQPRARPPVKRDSFQAILDALAEERAREAVEREMIQ
jgi:hypothetical protein